MYKGQSAMFAWLFHRVAGLGILLFLIIHDDVDGWKGRLRRPLVPDANESCQ